MFFVTVGGATSITSVFVKFKLRELELSQVFNSLTHANRVAVWWIESGRQEVYSISEYHRHSSDTENHGGE